MQSIVHFRVPDSLSQKLKAVARERCRTVSDVVREATLLHLDDLSRPRRATVSDAEPVLRGGNA